MIKIVFNILICFILVSCTSIPFTASESYTLIKGYTFGFAGDNVTQEDFDNNTYSFAVAKFGRGPSSKLVLAFIRDGVYEWRSSDNVSIYTKNGIVIKTEGLTSDISIFEDDNTYQIQLTNPSLFKTDTELSLKESRQRSVRYLDKEIEVESLVYNFKVPLIRWNEKILVQMHKGLPIHTTQRTHPSLSKIHINYFYKF